MLVNLKINHNNHNHLQIINKTIKIAVINVNATPSARRHARENGVNLSEVLVKEMTF